MAELKIKVRVSDLIAAIEARKAEVIAEHAIAIAEYPVTLDEWKRNAQRFLDEKYDGWVALIKAGKGLDEYSPFRPVAYPPQPRTDESLTYATAEHDKSLATLRMCPDDTITITASDYARYVK
jgi:hypothetical protein